MDTDTDRGTQRGKRRDTSGVFGGVRSKESSMHTIGNKQTKESEDLPWLTIHASLTPSGDSRSGPPCDNDRALAGDAGLATCGVGARAPGRVGGRVGRVRLRWWSCRQTDCVQKGNKVPMFD